MIKKYTATFIFTLALSAAAFAQTGNPGISDFTATGGKFAPAKDSTKKWDAGGSLALNFGQTFLANWASGGQNALSVSFTGLAHANYRNKKWMWDNNLVLGLGGIALFPQQKYGKDPMNAYPFRKNVDNLQLTSSAGYQIDEKGKWFVSVLVDFRTSLLNGYGNYAYDSTVNGGQDPTGKINSRQKISSFAAPAYLTVSAGITYQPVSWLTFYLAPLAGKFTFVNPKANIYNEDSSVANVPAIGATAYGLEKARSVYRAEFGWYFRMNLEKEVFKNVIIKTQVELFDNYLDKHHLDNIATTYNNPDDPTVSIYNGNPANVVYQNVGHYDNRKYVDVNWQTWITFKINKYLQASLEWQLLYDHDIAIPKYTPAANQYGIQGTYQGRGVQFREGLTLGLGYMF